MQVITQEEINKDILDTTNSMVEISLKANIHDVKGDFTGAMCWLDKVAALHSREHALRKGCQGDDLYGLVAENLSK